MFKPEFAKILFLTKAALNNVLRHGQAGFATDTNEYVIRDIAGNFHWFPAITAGAGNPDYCGFDANGTFRMYGGARTYRDELGDVTKLKRQGTGIVEDAAESAVGFNTLANLADYVYTNVQLNHDKDLTATIDHPHIHWWQTTANTPNWLLQWRWQTNGAAKTVAWSSAAYQTNIYAWAAGTINQITDWPEIAVPVGVQMSDIIQFRILRDNANASGLFVGADPVGATQYITSFDIHFLQNSIGSDSEYVK